MDFLAYTKQMHTFSGFGEMGGHRKIYTILYFRTNISVSGS